MSSIKLAPRSELILAGIFQNRMGPWNSRGTTCAKCKMRMSHQDHVQSTRVHSLSLENNLKGARIPYKRKMMLSFGARLCSSSCWFDHLRLFLPVDGASETTTSDLIGHFQSCYDIKASSSINNESIAIAMWSLN